MERAEEDAIFGQPPDYKGSPSTFFQMGWRAHNRYAEQERDTGRDVSQLFDASAQGWKERAERAEAELAVALDLLRRISPLPRGFPGEAATETQQEEVDALLRKNGVSSCE